MPVRIQRKRTKGWRMPEGAVYVGRPTKWGNPFRVGTVEIAVHGVGPRYETVCSADQAVRLFRQARTDAQTGGMEAGDFILAIRADLFAAQQMAEDAGADGFDVTRHGHYAAMKAFGGSIVGSVEVVDCVENSLSPWFAGPWGLVLRDPVRYSRPVPVVGQLGIFEVPALMVPEEGLRRGPQASPTGGRTVE